MSETPENDPAGRNGLSSSAPGTPGAADDSARQALSDLDQRVKDALKQRQAEAAAEEALIAKAEGARASGAAWRIMIDLIVATVLLGGLGFALDSAMGWSPAGLLTGLLVGFALGMWLAAQRALALQARNPKA